jgi:hypothetical protein
VNICRSRLIQWTHSSAREEKRPKHAGGFSMMKYEPALLYGGFGLKSIPLNIIMQATQPNLAKATKDPATDQLWREQRDVVVAQVQLLQALHFAEKLKRRSIGSQTRECAPLCHMEPTCFQRTATTQKERCFWASWNGAQGGASIRLESHKSKS